MLHLLIFNYRDRNSKGYTLAEMITVVAIVGIMCAIAVPSFLTIQGTAKLNNSLEKVRAALEITQFRASQKKKDEQGNTCRIYLPTIAPNNNKIIGNCLTDSNASSSAIPDTTDTGLKVRTGVTAGTLEGWAVITLDDNVIVESIQPNEAATGLAGNPPRVVYNLQGITQNGGLIVLGATGIADKRCLQVNTGVGLIRSGNYAGGTTCTVIQ